LRDPADQAPIASSAQPLRCPARLHPRNNPAFKPGDIGAQ
jgi:hypothetical protein